MFHDQTGLGINVHTRGHMYYYSALYRNRVYIQGKEKKIHLNESSQSTNEA